MSAATRETVLVTGASSGIGLELARCFAADGCRLILLARNTNALETLAGELRQAHKIETLVLTADLSRPETPARKDHGTTRSRLPHVTSHKSLRLATRANRLRCSYTSRPREARDSRGSAF